MMVRMPKALSIAVGLRSGCRQIVLADIKFGGLISLVIVVVALDVVSWEPLIFVLAFGVDSPVSQVYYESIDCQ